MDQDLDQYLWEQAREAYAEAVSKDENEKEHLREVLAYAVSCLLEIADLLSPFMPVISKKMDDLFSKKKVALLDSSLFPKE